MRAEGAVGAEAEAGAPGLIDVESAARASLDELRDVLGSLRDEPEVNRAVPLPRRARPK